MADGGRSKARGTAHLLKHVSFGLECVDPLPTSRHYTSGVESSGPVRGDLPGGQLKAMARQTHTQAGGADLSNEGAVVPGGVCLAHPAHPRAPASPDCPFVRPGHPPCAVVSTSPLPAPEPSTTNDVVPRGTWTEMRSAARHKRMHRAL